MIRLFVEIAWAVILPIFLLIGLGAWAKQALKLDHHALNKLNLYILVPALVFTKFLHADIGLAQIGLIALYWTLLNFILWGVGHLACVAARVAPARRGIVDMGFMFPNSGNYGIPVAELAFGSLGVTVQSVVLAMQNIVFFTFGTFLAGGGAASFRQGAAAALRIPVIYAIVAAFLLRAKPGLVPVPVDRAVVLLGDGLVPIALLTLGAQLGWGRIPSLTKDVRLIVAGRLLLSPFIGFLLLILLKAGPDLLPVLVVSASFPLAVNTALLAIEFRRQPDLANAGILWTTVLSALTVTCVIALVGR